MMVCRKNPAPGQGGGSPLLSFEALGFRGGGPDDLALFQDHQIPYPGPIIGVFERQNVAAGHLFFG